jgi:hypothetical protein
VFSPDHPFRVQLVPGAREAARSRYLDYLRRRNGEVDHGTRTLSRREQLFDRLRSESVSWKESLDRARFHRNHSLARPEAGLDPLDLWLLVVAKANRPETYAVELGFRTGIARRNGDQCLEVLVEVEEHYHTRMLKEALGCFALQVEAVPPPAAARTAIHSMIRLPNRLKMPMLLAAEVLGIAVFRLLIETARELFSNNEGVQHRVVEILQRIIRDEVGHAAYCRSQMGRFGLWISRLVSPFVVRSLIADIPEIDRLFGRQRLMDAIAGQDLLELSAEYGHDVWFSALVPPAARASTIRRLRSAKLCSIALPSPEEPVSESHESSRR